MSALGFNRSRVRPKVLPTRPVVVVLAAGGLLRGSTNVGPGSSLWVGFVLVDNRPHHGCGIASAEEQVPHHMGRQVPPWWRAFRNKVLG